MIYNKDKKIGCGRSRGSQLGFRVYEIQNRGMILADSSLILLILQSRFSLNFGWFRPNLTDSEWFLLILTDSGFKIDYFSSDYCVILSDSEQGCTKIVLSCDPLVGGQLRFTRDPSWENQLPLTSSPRVNEAELKGFVGYGFFHFLKKWSNLMNR